MSGKRFLIVGLGILGESVAKTLAQDGAEVVALDSNPLYVERIKDYVSVAISGDSTDPKLLEQIGCKNLDAAVVCIGENFSASVLTTAHLLDQGVKYVAVRATNELNASIFKRLGAQDVFFVENQMGQILAHRLQRPWIINEMYLGGDFSIVEWAAPDWMIGKTLEEISLPQTYSVQVIAVRNEDNPKDLQMPKRETKILKGHRLLLCGKNTDITKARVKG